MQAVLDFTENSKSARLEYFQRFVALKKAEGYEVRQYNIPACATVLKKHLHWIMTVRDETDPAILKISEWESTDVVTFTIDNRYSRMPPTTYKRRGWTLLNKYHLNF